VVGMDTLILDEKIAAVFAPNLCNDFFYCNKKTGISFVFSEKLPNWVVFSTQKTRNNKIFKI
jgi:hypothetical protein